MIPVPQRNQPFPVEALPDLFFSAIYHLRTLQDEIPLESLLTDAIAAAANAVHLTHDVRSLDERTMPCTLNTLASVASGLGKGTSYEYFFKPFNDFDAAQGIEGGKELLLLDVTYRALVDHLDGTCHNAALQDEDGASFLESDIFLRFLNRLAQLWSGHHRLPYKVHGATRFIVDGRCSLGMRIQPKIFTPFLKRTHIASFVQGLWPRAIAACYDPKRFSYPHVRLRPRQSGCTPNDFNDRVRQLLALEAQHRKTGRTKRDVVELDQHAAAFMIELKHRLKDWIESEYADIEEAARRAWENTLRLAAVFHVMCVGHGMIGEEMVQRAWDIVAWSLTQHRKIFVESLADPTTVASRSPPTRPRSTRIPRTNEDAQWLKECIHTVADRMGSEWVSASTVEALANLPGKRLSAAWKWLSFNEQIYTRTLGARRQVSIRLFASGRYGAL